MVSLFAMRATESRDGNVEPRTYVDLHPSFPPSTLSLHFGVPKVRLPLSSVTVRRDPSQFPRGPPLLVGLPPPVGGLCDLPPPRGPSGSLIPRPPPTSLTLQWPPSSMVCSSVFLHFLGRVCGLLEPIQALQGSLGFRGDRASVCATARHAHWIAGHLHNGRLDRVECNRIGRVKEDPIQADAIHCHGTPKPNETGQVRAQLMPSPLFRIHHPPH
mmetsp:Transcript_878/g.2608  ORF Transcript_878/g.2608 Transcript_878/m.2608 type:complete len:215 (-) Transcript_878:70-714(-)